MRRHNRLGFLVAMIIVAWSSRAPAAAFIEKDGRYEINWTTGKVRFYGVGKAGEADSNYRSAEQQAWANGLQLAEKNGVALLSGRLGQVSTLNPEKLSKLAASTVSVSTTYFGDQRVKVLLETPVEKMTPQMVKESALNAATAQPEGDSYVVVRLPRSAKPVAFVRVVDESGREMLAASDVANAVQNGASLSRWFKRDITGDASANGKQSDEIKAEYAAPGVIKVASSSWKPAYAAAIASGRGRFIVE